MNNTTLNIISVHLFSTGLPLELIDITHTWELYKGLMARWALNAPPVTGPSSTQPGVYLKIDQPAWGWKQNYWTQIVDFSACVTLKFDGWPRKTIGHVFYTMSSFLNHFKSISEFKLELQSENDQLGSILAIFFPVWPWNLMDNIGKQ